MTYGLKQRERDAILNVYITHVC